MSPPEALTELTPGMRIPIGNMVVTVDAALANAFQPGDDLITLPTTAEVLHVPARERAIAAAAVQRALTAFTALNSTSDEAITQFFLEFADRLEDDKAFAPIANANREDMETAAGKGRSTTRLELTPTMRTEMIAGLRTWATLPSGRGETIETVEHDGWSVDLIRAGLGTVGFVFEGRPNVFADACGVIRSGNTVVFRIGSDALTTARAIVEHALDPALAAAGVPAGAASLVESPAHAAGWALFSDARLSLAVARGSGPAVAQLGAIARQVGTPTSLHGTGGAWIIAGDHADRDTLYAAITHSLDRKVCNTLNTLVLPSSRAEELLPIALAAITAAADGRGTNPKVHLVGEPLHALMPREWFDPRAIDRAGGTFDEPGCETDDLEALGHEWEWERSPELTVTLADSLEAAVDLFNTWSPQFVASLVSGDEQEHHRFFNSVNAPFVGNGFTRWVDGQYALGTPELGLSNWQSGRLFGRGGVLAGDSVYTVRARVRQTNPDIHR